MDEEKVAVVTGASRGIGAAIARRLKDEGFYVVGLDLGEPLEACDEFYRCDVSDEASVSRIIGPLSERRKRIDVLVNVAGVVLVKPLIETEWKEFARVVNVNLGGTFLLLKHVVPTMKERHSGAVVNVASVSGHVGQVDHSLYGATKAAVIALCRSLAWELAPYGIRINSVSPGSVDTEMLRSDIRIESAKTGKTFDDVKALREQEQAFGRWAQPEEIANAVVFLASDAASFITGTDLLADCGWTAR